MVPFSPLQQHGSEKESREAKPQAGGGEQREGRKKGGRVKMREADRNRQRRDSWRRTEKQEMGITEISAKERKKTDTQNETDGGEPETEKCRNKGEKKRTLLLA